LEGHAFLRSDDGEQVQDVVNRWRMALDEAGTRCEIAGVGTERSEQIETRSPHVRRFLWQLDAAARRTSKADEVRAVPKDVQLGRKPKPRTAADELVPCPACDGGRWPDCPLCNGLGEVSRRQARGYLAQDA
jgi:hypothetical protein